MSFATDAFEATLANARKALLDARTPGGWWEGELSSSALSTATAVFSLHLFLEFTTRLETEAEATVTNLQTEKACQKGVSDGLGWLAMHQNRDGGWGDTTLSLSNISTTALCWAAFSIDSKSPTPAYASVTLAAETWLTQQAGGCDPAHLVPAIIARYGKDKTFSVPILTMCALADRLGEGRAAWRKVPQLPFELAAFPQRGFKWLRLPVVSYALPALIAIGLVRHVKRTSWNLAGRLLRILARRRVMKLLARIQPASGGFLEATPLTSFVVMSLIGAGEAAHGVVKQGIAFLLASLRPDGSWPIDTNLATWVTTLAVNALAQSPDFHTLLPEPDRRKIHEWLLAQQYRQEHPYTLADPGGWAWTPLSGGVPDADDTPGALLALKNLGISDARTDVVGSAPRTITSGADESVRSPRTPVPSVPPPAVPRRDSDPPPVGAPAALTTFTDDPVVGSAPRTVIPGTSESVRDADPTQIDPTQEPSTPGQAQRRPGFFPPRDNPGRRKACPGVEASRDEHDRLSTEVRTKKAVVMGIKWLLDLQNRDGGIPTFCRGWGKLPFDRSSADLTAHALRAIDAWKADLPPDLAARAESASARAIEFLIRTQQSDGSWLPLWFGNQHAPGDINPTYGTARVLLAAGPITPTWAQRLSLAIDWLLSAQRPGGGWGAGHDTPPSIEETALAVEALTEILRASLPIDAESTTAHSLINLIDYEKVRTATKHGIDWLMNETDLGQKFGPSPIGFYFAKLWYFEKLYPLIFTVAALESVRVMRST